MSTNSERLAFRGWLLEQENKERALRLKISGLRDSLRSHLSLLEKEEELPGEMIAQQALELRSAQIDLVTLQEEIKAKKKAFAWE